MAKPTAVDRRKVQSRLHAADRRWYTPVLGLLVIAAAFAVVHGSRVRDNYSTYQWEDKLFIRHNEATIHSLKDCFTKRPVWNGLYRPLTTNLYYFIGRKLFASRIEVYHLINLSLYLANALLLYLICLNFLPHAWALLPPAIFVSRISHVEVISNACEFQTLCSVFFTLLAFKLFMMARTRQRIWPEVFSLGVFILALLSKETAIVFPLLLFAFGWLFDTPRAWLHYIAPLLAVALWTVLFVLIFRAVTGYKPTGFAYDVSFSNVAGSYSAYFLVFFNLFTYGLQNIVMVPAVAELAAADSTKLIFTVLPAAAGIFFVLHRRMPAGYGFSARVTAFGFIWFVIVIAPYVVLQSRLYMRYSYFGHAGLAICTAVLLRELKLLLFPKSSKHFK